MSVSDARRYIRRLRAEVPLRQQFELVWQGRRRDPDEAYRVRGEPVVPRALASPAPDDRTDPEGSRRWWRRLRAQQDMHDLLFSRGDGRDHAQDYLDGEMVTAARITEVIDRPETSEALALLARIATACTGDDVGTDDMKAAWHGYVRWIYQVTEYAGPHPEVRRLRADAATDAALRARIDDAAGDRRMSLGAALALASYMETGFAAEGACERFEKDAAWLGGIARAAAGYRFTGLDYLRDCMFRQQEEDPGPARDERYWPEDDPNRWNHEPPPVRFAV